MRFVESNVKEANNYWHKSTKMTKLNARKISF